MRASIIAAMLAATGAMAMVTPADAWVHYGGGGWHDGGAGGWHGGVTVGGYHGGWGYGYHGGCWGCGGWGAAAAGAAVGVAAGVAIGASVARLPPACGTYPGGYYSCGGVYYQPYYGPNGLVYKVVPAP